MSTSRASSGGSPGRAHGDAADAQLVHRPRQLRLFMEWDFGQAGTTGAQGGRGQGPAGIAAYRRVGGGYQLHTLQIFTVTARGISRNRCSRIRGLRVFGLAADSTPGTCNAASSRWRA